MDTRSMSLAAAASLAGSLVLSGCVTTELEGDFSTTSDGTSIVLIDNRAATLEGNVCDPFAYNPERPLPDEAFGLAGTFRYLSDDHPKLGRMQDFRTLAHEAPVSVFLNEVNVRTRLHDKPSKNQKGVSIKHPDSRVVDEHFSVHLSTRLRLDTADNEGLYQLAILADDGSVIEVAGASGMETLIGNDGFRQATLSCASRALTMSRSTALPVDLHAFQGPRGNMTFILLWREWDGVTAETECGKSGDGYFFNSGTPTTAYEGMLARGWKVLTPANFLLPSKIADNPCSRPDPVVTQVTGFVPSAVTNNRAATFTFESNYADATFDCSLNGSAPVPCTSPKTYEYLADGNHVFEVHATSNGIRDEVGATHHWRIDTTASRLVFLSVTSTSNTLEIKWATDEPTVGWLQWGPTTAMGLFTPESAGLLTNHRAMLTELIANRNYYFQLNGRDEAGNVFRSSRFSTMTSP